MVQWIKKSSDLPYYKLMQLYDEFLCEQTLQLADKHGISAARVLAEQELYGVVSDMLDEEHGYFAVVVEEDRFSCGLRLENFQDGYLISGLHTAVDCRGRGLAAELIKACIIQWKHKPIYSHIAKDNFRSLHIHESCGFKKISDTATMLDGRHSGAFYTYCYNPVNQDFSIL